MVKVGEIYKCSVCGNIVEVNYAGGGELVCCGKPMILQTENMDDSASKEKHVPVIIDGNLVRVGSVLHPSEEKHYIMWIEAEDENGEVERISLEPGEEPEVGFDFDVKVARAFCNLHGLWRSK